MTPDEIVADFERSAKSNDRIRGVRGWLLDLRR